MKFFRVVALVLAISAVTAATKILKCDFKVWVKDQYSCKIERQNFADDAEVTFQTTGHATLNDVVQSNDDVRQVFFLESKMSHVPNQIFVIFPRVFSVFFEKTGLKQWKREYLKGAKFLRSLNIWENDIEIYKDDAFAEVPQLQVLLILKNKIKTINPNMFNVFHSLDTLDFRHNDFSRNLPIGIFDAVAGSVTDLNLSMNQITEFPVGFFKNFKNLRELNIDENDLAPIDASLTFPNSLKEVYVCKFC